MALIQAGVLQSGILSPFLFNIYASDQPITQDTLVADFEDDKVIIAIHENHLIASANLQIHLDLISQWKYYVENKTKPQVGAQCTRPLR